MDGRDANLTDQVWAAFRVVEEILDVDLVAAYVYGSAVAGRLRPQSDVDLFVVSERRTTERERRALVDRLTPISDRRARPRPWRPTELTIVAQADVTPWRYPARTDFQWGEWLRPSFDAGHVPEPHANPDLAVLCAQVRDRSEALFGPPAAELLDPVPRRDLVRAMRESVAGLVGDLETDTTNVLLTLARIWHTHTTNGFTSKDTAANWALDRLPAVHHRPLELARDEYLGRRPAAWDGWADRGELVAGVANALVRKIERTR